MGCKIILELFGFAQVDVVLWGIVGDVVQLISLASILCVLTEGVSSGAGYAVMTLYCVLALLLTGMIFNPL